MKARIIIFHENSVSGKTVVPWGRKDRHDKSNSRFLTNSRPRLKCLIIWLQWCDHLRGVHNENIGTSLNITVQVYTSEGVFVSTVQYWLTLCQLVYCTLYEGWNFNSGNYLFTTDTK